MKTQTDFEDLLNGLTELEKHSLIAALIVNLDRENQEHLLTPILKEYTFTDKVKSISRPDPK